MPELVPELEHFVMVFLAMHERERERRLLIFSMLSGCHPLEGADLQLEPETKTRCQSLKFAL